MALHTVTNIGPPPANTIFAADVNQYHDLFTGSMTDQAVSIANETTVKDLVVTGKPGATQAVAIGGGTTGGAPVTGAHVLRELAWDSAGAAWICTAAGTPGSWQQVGAPPAPATTTTDGTVKVTQNMGGDPVALVTADRGAANGVAELDSGSHVPLAELSGITHSQLDASAGITSGQIASIPSQNTSILTAGTLPVARGGTGSGTAPTDGQIPIGSTSSGDYAPAAITAGVGISVTPSAHGLQIAATGAEVGPATTTTEGVVKVDNNMAGDPVAVTTASVGAASGVAELDSGGHVPLAELSGITHSQLDAAAGITSGQIASVNPSALTGSGTVPDAALPNEVSAGTSAYPSSVTVDAKGRVTAITPGSAPGAGSVTSVAMTVPADESVSGSPITGAGTLAITRNAQSGNKGLFSPSDGSSGTPAFRAAVAADIPSLDASKIGSGTLALARLSGITTSQLNAAAGILAAQIATSGIIAAGTHAGRPAAGQAGLLYYETDTLKVFRDSGSAWVEWDLTAAVITSGLLAQARGGTNLDTSGATDGQLLIGQTSDHSLGLGTISAGSGMAVTNSGHGISLATTAGGPGTAYTQLAQTVLGSDTATISFSSISGSYTSLQIYIVARCAGAGFSYFYVRFNSDSGANYDWIQWFTSSQSTAADTRIKMGPVAESGANANAASACLLTIHNYADNANWWKQLTHHTAMNNPGAGELYNFTGSGHWRSTAAITSVTIGILDGSNLKANSKATLYGIS